jgi:hypothetical protein
MRGLLAPVRGSQLVQDRQPGRNVMNFRIPGKSGLQLSGGWSKRAIPYSGAPLRETTAQTDSLHRVGQPATAKIIVLEKNTPDNSWFARRVLFASMDLAAHDLLSNPASCAAGRLHANPSFCKLGHPVTHLHVT